LSEDLARAHELAEAAKQNYDELQVIIFSFAIIKAFKGVSTAVWLRSLTSNHLPPHPCGFVLLTGTLVSFM
jgi:hypothetical protein